MGNYMTMAEDDTQGLDGETWSKFVSDGGPALAQWIIAPPLRFGVLFYSSHRIFI